MIIRHALEEAPYGDFGDEPSQLRAQAKMLAGAEAEMSERPPFDVEGVRIGKFALVAVGRAEGERDFVAGADGLAVHGHIARGGALEALRRRIKAQRFLDRRRDQRRIGDEPPPRVRIVVQIEREHAHEA